MALKIAWKYRHVVIIMAFLTPAACTDVQVPVNCTNGAVITSPNYPSTYPQFEHIDWFFTAPEGRMILLTFNNFSLGSSDDVVAIDIVDDLNRQRYNGEENTIPPFLSRRNSLLLRFTSDENPTGNGFNISATCYELSGTRVGRLVGGNTPAEGFLELQAKSGNEWMRVCEEHSADRVAEVVCGELGFPGVKEVSYEQGGCSSEGADQDCIRSPRCENYAYRSQDCSAISERCTSSLAAKVKCFEPGFKGCYDLGHTNLKNGSSYNSTSKCVISCRVATSKAIAIINESECFCSTADDIGLSSLWQVEARSCTPHQLVYNASDGYCNQMDDVIHGSWDSDITWFGSIVHLTCDDGYRLNGIGTLQCITEVSSYLLVWNGSIPSCEMITVTTQGIYTTAQSTDINVTFSEDNTSTFEDCGSSVEASILKPVLMGSTYGLAAFILIILIYWITTHVRQHFSSKKQDSVSHISHTTLDMTRQIQRGNAGVRSEASARVLARSQEVAVGRVTIRTDSVLYETIPDVTLAGPSKRTEGEQNTEEDASGYINQNPQPNWNKMATADGAWNPRRHPQAQVQRQHELDAGGYLVPNVLQRN